MLGSGDAEILKKYLPISTLEEAHSLGMKKYIKKYI